MRRLDLIVIYPLFLFLCSGCSQKPSRAILQSPIANGNFEQWDSVSFLLPQFTIEASNPRAYFFCNTTHSLVQVTDAYHGRYAIQLNTLKGSAENIPGYFANCRLNGRANTWLGGVAYAEKPRGITGYYKCSIPAGDSAIVFINFKLKERSVGYYEVILYGKHNDYTPFMYTFNPPLYVVPDTIMFGAVSSYETDSLFQAMEGSMLQLDSVSLIGVEHQPVMFDGDFETWQKQVYAFPSQWTPQSGHGEGVSMTTDAYAGKYALELTTFLGDIDGTPSAEAGTVTSSYRNRSCSCYQNGFPFSNQSDTLEFYFKYSSMINSDSAQVNLAFRKNGLQFQSAEIKLGATTKYQKAQLPFHLFQKPDTVLIQIQSTALLDFDVHHLGSVLKIDELHFKSER